MPNCIWVSSFELNFLDKNSWVLIQGLSTGQVDEKIFLLLC